MPDVITLKAAAKINLTLDVAGMRPDGYHNIKSVMQSISLYDTLTVKRRSDGAVNVSCSDKSVPSGEQNIAFRAVSAYFEVSGTRPFGVDVIIDKKIPVQAGLGGGSADAAGTLVALNRLNGNALDMPALRKAGESAGSDVPFCVEGGTRLCVGRGELTSPLRPLPDCFIVIAKGAGGISTKEAYEKISAIRRGAIREAAYKAFENVNSNVIARLSPLFYNIFEEIIPEEVKRVKSLISGFNPLCAVMSGSGAAVYGVFEDGAQAERCLSGIIKTGYFGALCHPVKKGVEFFG